MIKKNKLIRGGGGKRCFRRPKQVRFFNAGQWLWINWQSGSLPIPEVRSSNPVISKKLYRTFTVNCIEQTKIKKKRPGMGHILKGALMQQLFSPFGDQSNEHFTSPLMIVLTRKLQTVRLQSHKLLPFIRLSTDFVEW